MPSRNHPILLPDQFEHSYTRSQSFINEGSYKFYIKNPLRTTPLICCVWFLLIGKSIKATPLRRDISVFNTRHVNLRVKRITEPPFYPWVINGRVGVIIVSNTKLRSIKGMTAGIDWDVEAIANSIVLSFSTEGFAVVRCLAPDGRPANVCYPTRGVSGADWGVKCTIPNIFSTPSNFRSRAMICWPGSRSKFCRLCIILCVSAAIIPAQLASHIVVMSTVTSKTRIQCFIVVDQAAGLFTEEVLKKEVVQYTLSCIP